METKRFNTSEADPTEQLSAVEIEQLSLFGNTFKEREKYFKEHGLKLLNLIQQVENFPGYMGKPPLVGTVLDNRNPQEPQKLCHIDLERILYLNTKHKDDAENKDDNEDGSGLSFFVRLSQMGPQTITIIFSAPINSAEKPFYQNEALYPILNSCQMFSSLTIENNQHKDERKFSVKDFSCKDYENWEKKYVIKKFPIFIKSDGLGQKTEPVFCFNKDKTLYEFHNFFEAVIAALSYVLTPEQISKINYLNYDQISFAAEYDRTPYLPHVVKAVNAVTKRVLCLDINGVLGGQLKTHYLTKIPNQSTYPDEFNTFYLNDARVKLTMGSLNVVGLFEKLSQEFHICTTSHGGLKSTIDFFKDIMDQCELKNKPYLQIQTAVINDPFFKEYTVKNPVVRQEILRTTRGNEFKITIIGFFAESKEYKGKQDLFTALSHIIPHNPAESHVVDDASSVLNEVQKHGYQTHLVDQTHQFESVLEQIANEERQKEVPHKIDLTSHKIDFSFQFPEKYTKAIQNHNYLLANEVLLRIYREIEHDSTDNANYMFELFWLYKEILPFFIDPNECKTNAKFYYDKFSEKYKNLRNETRFELTERFLLNKLDFVFKFFPDYSISDDGKTIVLPPWLILTLKTNDKKYFKLSMDPFGIIYIGELLLQQESYIRKDLTSDEERKICKLLQDYADKGSVFAQYYYAEMLYQGIFVTADKERAFGYAEKAADKLHTKAVFLLSKMLLERKAKGREIVHLWQMCVNVNYPDAIFNLATCYKEGDKDKGIAKNAQKAFEYYKKIVNNDNNKHSNALFELAKCYENGIGCTKDPKAAFDSYQEAVTNGYKAAFFELAKCYENGIGCTKDPKAAFDSYQEAFNHRDMRVFFELAKYYHDGIGCTKNLRTAFNLYQGASNHKDMRAFFELAKCYQDGIGCEINKGEALKYFKLAQQHDPNEEIKKKAEKHVAQLITPPSASHYIADSVPVPLAFNSQMKKNEQLLQSITASYSNVPNSSQPFGRTQTLPVSSQISNPFQFQEDNNRVGTPTQISNNALLYTSSPGSYQTTPVTQQSYNMPHVYPGGVFHSYSQAGQNLQQQGSGNSLFYSNPNFSAGGQYFQLQGYNNYPYPNFSSQIGQYPQQSHNMHNNNMQFHPNVFHQSIIPPSNNTSVNTSVQEYSDPDYLKETVLWEDKKKKI